MTVVNQAFVPVFGPGSLLAHLQQYGYWTGRVMPRRRQDRLPVQWSTLRLVGSLL